MNGISIVIVSYNNIYLMQRCLDSIRNTCETSDYEVIVVDNSSTDGVREWLCEQDDIKTIVLDENVGFPMGCNIGAQYAEPGNDIFLLNNDTRLCEKSLSNLQRGLYSDETIGAVGAIANYAGNEQEIAVEFDLPSEYVSFGEKINTANAYVYEYRPRLCGFAILIKRHIWDEIGGVDEDFSPGYIEDDDLSMRITMLGYRLMVCKDSFIYHAGSQSFAHKEGLEDIIKSHLDLFIQKYGFDAREYVYPNKIVLDRLIGDCNTSFNMLVLGAKLGADIDYIQSKYPNARIVGVETNTCLYAVSSKARMILRSVDELLDTINVPVFDVIYVCEGNCISDNEINRCFEVCKTDFIMLS